MQAIFLWLIVGAVCLMVAMGNNGLIAHMITGTNTASFMIRVGYPLAIGLTVIIAIIFKVVRGKKPDK